MRRIPFDIIGAALVLAAATPGLAAAQATNGGDAPASASGGHDAEAAPTPTAPSQPAGQTGTGGAATTPSGSAAGASSAPSSAMAPAGIASGAAPTAAATPAANAPGVVLAPAALAVKPGDYKLDPEHGKITWSVNHLGFSTYVGQFPGVGATLTLDPHDLADASLDATIDLASVDTDNAKLNDNLKGESFFNTSKFPTATFKSTKVTPTGPRTARIDGTLTLRGKTSPVVISATFNNAGVDPVDKRYTVGFDGAAIIRRSTFGVSAYVPFVGDDVLVRIEGEFKPAS